MYAWSEQAQTSEVFNASPKYIAVYHHTPLHTTTTTAVLLLLRRRPLLLLLLLRLRLLATGYWLLATATATATS